MHTRAGSRLICQGDVGKRYKYKLSVLRDLGWKIWDPIGLVADRSYCEDEYDTYLLQVIGKITNGVSPNAIVDYLIDVEQNYMGIGEVASSRTRAEQLVAAIFDYAASLAASEEDD